MKKILKIVLCALLVFTFIPREEVQAEDPGYITNITFDSNGKLTWDAYPGAAYYIIAFTGYQVSGKTTGTSYDQLRTELMNKYQPAGKYGAQVSAYDRIGNHIATGTSTNVYDYAPLYGKMPTSPNGPKWVNGYQASFNTVPGASLYEVTLYCDGEYITDIWVANPGVGLAYYCFGPGRKYTFRVAAMAYGYSKSDPSGPSDEVEGNYRFIGRIYGKNRYETAIDSANMLRQYKWGSPYVQFDDIVLTTGTNYPDALSGSCLANAIGAPILLISKGSAATVVDYINKSLSPSGTLYILGGDSVVENGWLTGLDPMFKQVRLSGKTRYQTNLEILKEYYKRKEDEGVTNKYTMLVCTGNGFADSLSCSALDYPILLVGKSLSAEQKAFLSGIPKDLLQFYIIGGTGAVSDSVAYELADYGLVNERIAGKDRYDTSAQIANKFHYRANYLTFATGKDFPDGLSGGPLAFALGAPLVLVADGHIEYAHLIADVPNLGVGYFFGGQGAISNDVLADVIGMEG